VDPKDTVLLGGKLFFMPSRYIGTALEHSALEQYKDQDDFADVLAKLAQCDQMSLQGLQGCDASCMLQLCRSGLSKLWQDALSASAAQQLYGEIPMQLSAAASFDDTAVLTGFKGDWVGQVMVGDITAPVTGEAVGKAPETEPPAQ